MSSILESGKDSLNQDTPEETRDKPHNSLCLVCCDTHCATRTEHSVQGERAKTLSCLSQLSVFPPPRSTYRSTHHPTGQSGIGAVYGYDAVGSFERVRVACAGGGLSLMQPVLDRLDAAEAATGAGGGGRAGREQPVVAVGLEEALALVRRAFVAGGERDISLGDEVEIVVVTRKGHRRERLQLKSH